LKKNWQAGRQPGSVPDTSYSRSRPHQLTKGSVSATATLYRRFPFLPGRQVFPDPDHARHIRLQQACIEDGAALPG
jgi:hypothetical protein